MNNIYVENGYNDRHDYLRSLSEEYGMNFDTVLTIAHMYGPNEDFDGLVSEIQNISEY